MKVGKLATGVVLVGLCCTRLPAAQPTEIEPRLLQPQSVQTTAFEYDSYLGSATGSSTSEPGRNGSSSRSSAKQESTTASSSKKTSTESSGTTDSKTTAPKTSDSSMTWSSPKTESTAPTTSGLRDESYGEDPMNADSEYDPYAPSPTSMGGDAKPAATPAAPAAPAAKPAAPATPAPAAATPPAVAPQNAPLTPPNDTAVATESCPVEEPVFRMPQLGALQGLGITTGGWLQQGITFNGDRPADRFNGPMAITDRANEYQMNQLWLYFDRPTKTDGCGFDLGGHLDIAYGTDWRYGSQYGLESKINSSQNFYGLILPQFYLQAAVNDLTVKMGHFATAMGNEVVPAPANFFYSHSYLLSYTEPLLVFGLLADYKLTDQWTILGGFHRGWMMYDDMNHDLDFLGGVKWKSCDEQTELSFMLNTGRQDVAALHNRFNYALTLKHKLTDQLQYAIQNNYVVEEGTSRARPGSSAAAYGISQWLTYQICPHWSAGGRFEWFRDNDGAYVAGVGNWIGSGRGWQGQPGFVGDFYEFSMGLNWHPHANVVLRPEVRWDWYDGSRNVANALPFDGGSKDHQFTTAVDLIVTF